MPNEYRGLQIFSPRNNVPPPVNSSNSNRELRLRNKYMNHCYFSLVTLVTKCSGTPVLPLSWLGWEKQRCKAKC